MGQYEDKAALLRKYYQQITTSYGFDIKGEISSQKIDNAIKTFAPGLDRSKIIGFYDTTITGSGKSGYLFTDTKVYYKETLEKPKKIWYDEIERVELFDTYKKDCDCGLTFHMVDGSEISWTSCFLNKTPLFHFFEDLLKMIHEPPKEEITETGHNSSRPAGATAGGIATGTYGTVNKLYEEERFHSRQGHGFAAERANNLFDQLTGHDARIVGDDNAKNGADRIVDGTYIQSKYCATGSKCVNECFENNGNGKFRYYEDGQPMQIEVPSDKYEAAVQAMEEKIRNGQVEGVSDPQKAKDIIRKGHFTYEQAKNIARAGTVESLVYDAVTGTIIATSAFGVTALITFATSIWNGEDFNQAIKFAAYSGLKVGGTAFLTSIIASQLSKAGLNSALVGSSEAIVAFMGPKASAILINAFRSGTKIYGAAAMKSAAKLLRGNTITAGITVVVLSSVDIANIFSGRISGKQLFKNLTSTATTVAGGTGGWLAGSAVGSMLFPGIGTIVGGIIGSIGAGAAAGRATDAVLGSFIEDDADEMVRIIEKVFQEMAADYLINQKEAEKCVDRLREELSGKTLKDMFASSDRKAFAKNLLTPIVESELSKREKIKIPTNDQMIMGVRIVLEELSDSAEFSPA